MNYRFTAWPIDALEKVAQKFLGNMEFTDAIKENCVTMCKHFHTSVQDSSLRY